LFRYYIRREAKINFVLSFLFSTQ